MSPTIAANYPFKGKPFDCSQYYTIEARLHKCLQILYDSLDTESTKVVMHLFQGKKCTY